MKEKYGFPVFGPEDGDIFEFLEKLGLKKWPREETISIEEYLHRFPEREKLVRRFAPKVDVVFLRQPDGKVFDGFRGIGENGAIVFVLLPGDFVVVVAEFVHGAGVIRLKPPAGVVPPGKDPREIAKREVLEETRIELLHLIELAEGQGIPDDPRRLSMREYMYLGIPKLPIEPRKQKPDATEFLKAILIPLRSWLRLIDEGKVLDMTSIGITHLALRKLGLS